MRLLGFLKLFCRSEKPSETKTVDLLEKLSCKIVSKTIDILFEKKRKTLISSWPDLLQRRDLLSVSPITNKLEKEILNGKYDHNNELRRQSWENFIKDIEHVARQHAHVCIEAFFGHQA